MKKLILLIVLGIWVVSAFSNFPTYIEINVGETIKYKDDLKVKLVAKRVTYFDSTLDRIGAAEVDIVINNNKYTLPVGYENHDMVIENFRIGVELISDYEKAFVNKRIHLNKDVRLRIAKAGESLMPKGSHVYPLFTPWNSGWRKQGWLTVCYNIETLEGKKNLEVGRYHDGWDFGAWEGQRVRSVSKGIVVSPEQYPEFIEKDLLYNKNNAPVGPNPFLVKHPELPLIYYYTHLSGITRNYHLGDTVKKGEVIGYASNRGSSGGWYQLHFSMIHTKKMVHINPFPFIHEWYIESMDYYTDFLSNFKIFLNENQKESPYAFERKIITNQEKYDKTFNNSTPGIIHMREAIADCPYSGLNHVLFDQYTVLQTKFDVEKAMDGELWFGHTGISRLYLNGKLVYSGHNTKHYNRSIQPFQWDSEMILCNFQEGKNKIVIAIEQTSPFYSFSIRPRNRLGMPLKN